MATDRSIETLWRLGGVPVDYHVGAEPTVTPGESYDFRAVITSESDSSNGVWPNAPERKRELLAYGRRAGEFALHGIDNGRVGYTETHDGAVPGGSLVVAVRPPPDSSGRGGWYLVESVEDATTLPDVLHDMAISLVYLAPLAQAPADRGYQTRTELAFDLEADTLSKT